jgi:hypothetical protein
VIYEGKKWDRQKVRPPGIDGFTLIFTLTGEKESQYSRNPVDFRVKLG